MSRTEKARRVQTQIKKIVSAGSALSVNELRIVLALERIVARLVEHKELAKHLVYKGGFVLMKILGSERFTRDLDALGVGIDKDDVARFVPEALAIDIDDGFWFGDIKIKPLDEQGEYGALRFDAAFQIGTPSGEKIGKLSRVHFDVGFGDKIPSKLKPLESASLLAGEPPISWRVYPPEYIFSEKLQTLVARGSANSRAKDVYDLVLLFGRCTDHEELRKAVRGTFKTRETDIPESFHDFAKGLNLIRIETSRKSVQLEVAGVDFKTVWSDLLRTLREFDEVLSKP